MVAHRNVADFVAMLSNRLADLLLIDTNDAPASGA